jgi:hypothetical protein
MFISDVNTAFEPMNPNHKDKLHKIMLISISGEPKTATAYRHLDSCKDFGDFLEIST